MTIPALGSQIKRFLGRIPTDALIVAVIFLTATLSFGLGVLAGKDMETAERPGIWIEERPVEAADLSAAAQGVIGEGEDDVDPIVQGGQYVASKSGEAYYLPWCGGVSRIKEENRVWFDSKEEAEAKGYRPAKNCKGI
ncbi:MAG TPA: Ada metal-binding domain-containing protein [Candidatus Paceibacterota bacterium]|nr:Ada metal-binding domain-containing protein [Candidatus Paceibacterota bacterium]